MEMRYICLVFSYIVLNTMNSPISSSQPQSKPTVLIIEDNTDQWFIIRWALLQRFPEVQAVWKSDLHQAVSYLEACLDGEQQLPKLIFLDLYLPQSSTGWTMLRILKTHDIYQQIPVVTLSNSDKPTDINESYKFGTNSYAVKPKGYEEWLACFATFRHYWWQAISLPELV